jgi:lipoprotein-releasing system permease protein
MGQDFWASPWVIAALVGAGLLVLGLVAIVLTTSVYKHVICLKYLFSGWKAVVPIVTALPAALGVFLLIVVFAIMDGFANDMREIARGTLADVIVDAHLEGIPYYDEYIRRIEKIEGVEVATPVITTLAVARIQPHREKYLGVELQVKPQVRQCIVFGIHPTDKAKLGRFLEYLEEKDRAKPELAADLLTVPEKYKKTWKAPHYGCIAGKGLIGWPKAEMKSEEIQHNADWRVLAVALAVAAGIVFLFLRQAARRRPGRRGWRVAAFLAAGATVALVITAIAIPVYPVVVEREQVDDFPLIDYGGELVVATIPIDPSGKIVTDPLTNLPKAQARGLELANIFKSNFWQADSEYVYVDFEVAQAMAGMQGQVRTADEPAVPARTSQIHIKVTDPARRKAVIAQLRREWNSLVDEHPDIGIMKIAFNTWEDQQKMILTVVEVEKGITVLMLGMMLLGFIVLIALVSYVLAYIKSRDVGILKAVGARDAGVGSLFLGYGFIIGLVGTALGLTMALLMLSNLDAIELWVNQALNIKVFPRDMYYFEHIPRHLSAQWCIFVTGTVLALSTLASMAGGLLATLKQPVEALRYE